MTPPRRPTLKTIADLTGLAVPTVSRALSGASDIGEATRARVRAVADQVGYVPNMAGVRLRTGRTQVVAMALATQGEVNSHTTRLVASVAETLSAARYSLIISPYLDTDPGNGFEAVREIVETGSADAVILNRLTPHDPRVRYLMDRGFPFATHGRSMWCENHAYYDFDNKAFARIAVEALVARGRRSLRLVAPPPEQSYARAMIEGFRTAVRHGGVAGEVVEATHSDQSVDQIEAGVLEILRQASDVDGVICASATAAVGTVGAIELYGHHLGDAVDVVGKDAGRLLPRFRSSLLSVYENTWQAGTFLAQAAVGAITDDPGQPMQHLDVPDALRSAASMS